MNCPSCGRELLASDTRCPACGTPVAQTGAPAAGAGSRGASQYRFDRSHWSPTDLVAGTATLVLFIALFLPWYGVSLGVIGITVSGLTAHGYLYLVFILCLLELGYLLAVAGLAEVRNRMPVPHELLLTVVNAINLLIVLIAFTDKGPSGIGWRYGAFIGLIAAVVAALPKAAIALSQRVRRR